MLTYQQLETIAKILGRTVQDVENAIGEINESSMPMDVESFLTDGEITDEDGDPLPAGVYGRLSMPGYLDCTDWSGPFQSEEEAVADLLSQYAE